MCRRARLTLNESGQLELEILASGRMYPTQLGMPVWPGLGLANRLGDGSGGWEFLEIPDDDIIFKQCMRNGTWGGFALYFL